MNNDALREFVENHGPITIVGGEIQECDWDYLMDELDELHDATGDLIYTLDTMSEEDRIEWLKKHNLAYQDGDC